jgi:hypothetical protein
LTPICGLYASIGLEGRPKNLQGLDHIVGAGPVDGFRLELDAIWEGV